MKRLILLAFGALFILLISCNEKNTEKKDEIYSRHLQRHVQLSIINTPIPEDHSRLNLLILNDGQDLEELRLKRMIDSLWEIKSIEPCVIVGVHAGNSKDEYGVSTQPKYINNGKKADDYAEFINNELYPYAKKMSGVRTFKSVSIAGWGDGGVSAMDIAFTYSDKITKVGVFADSVWWRNDNQNDSNNLADKHRIMYLKMKRSRKKPALEFWFGYNKSPLTSSESMQAGKAGEDLLKVLPLLKGWYHENYQASTLLASLRANFPFFLQWALGNKD